MNMEHHRTFSNAPVYHVVVPYDGSVEVIPSTGKRLLIGGRHSTHHTVHSTRAEHQSVVGETSQREEQQQRHLPLHHHDHGFHLSTVKVPVNDGTPTAVTLNLFPTAYRIHYSVVDKKSSWMRGTHRSIRWVFGQPNVVALQSGKSGRDCRGQEDEVVVVWSKKKKKNAKLQVYWNNVNISAIATAATCRPRPKENMYADERTVVASWTLASGMVLEIVTNRTKTNADIDLYELHLDRTNFMHLPSAGELGRRQPKTKITVSIERPAQLPSNDVHRISIHETDPEDPVSSEYPTTTVAVPTRNPDEEVSFVASNSLGFRLSMAGFKPQPGFDDPLEDELRSDLYSPVESLRSCITKYLPQAEEMVSRAIINAFFGDRESLDALSIHSNDADDMDPFVVHANYVCDAYQWWKANTDGCDRGIEDEERAIRYMQKRVDEIFVRVRNDELDATEAAHIVFGMAAVLGLTFSENIASTTMIIQGFDEGITHADLQRSLSSFGTVEAVSIASSSSLAFCRFRHEISSNSIIKAVDTDTENILGSDDIRVLIVQNNRFAHVDLCGRWRLSSTSDSHQHPLDDSGDDSTCAAVAPPDTSPQLLVDSMGSEGFALYMDSAQYTWTPQSV